MTIKQLHKISDPFAKFTLDYNGCSYPLSRDEQNPLFIACANYVIAQITPAENEISILIKTIPATE